MTAPHPPSSPPPAESASDRRNIRRGHFTVVWNLVFRALRKLGAHGRSVYTAVGIFLIAGVLVAIAGTVGFAKLAEIVREGYTQQFDTAVLHWLGAHHTPMLTTIMTEVTPLGTGIVVLVVVGVTSAFLWHTEHKHSARMLLAATAGNILLNNGLKLLFDRERPAVFEWGTHAASSSFPSGHAMSATVVFGTVAYLLARLQKHVWSRAITLLLAVVMIALICLTRLYLGVHYPSDVLGGIVVGLAWSGFCMATLEASLALARRRAPASVVEEAPAPVEHVATLSPSASHAVPASPTH
jgi:membrane-associated phospholipid phosphatase